MYQSHTNSAFDLDTKSKAREIISNSIMHVNVISNVIQATSNINSLPIHVL